MPRCCLLDTSDSVFDVSNTLLAIRRAERINSTLTAFGNKLNDVSGRKSTSVQYSEHAEMHQSLSEVLVLLAAAFVGVLE
jgi:hypothetical protein